MKRKILLNHGIVHCSLGLKHFKTKWFLAWNSSCQLKHNKTAAEVLDSILARAFWVSFTYLHLSLKISMDHVIGNKRGLISGCTDTFLVTYITFSALHGPKEHKPWLIGHAEQIWKGCEFAKACSYSEGA